MIAKTISRLLKEETGSIAVMFTLVFVVLVGFSGLAIDIGSMSLKRLQLLEVGHCIREARFNETLSIDNSEDPEAVLNEIAKNYAVKNGLDADQVNVDYYQTKLTQTERDYELDINLTDTYHCLFLNVYGIESIPITVSIHGTSTATKSPRIWAPGR